MVGLGHMARARPPAWRYRLPVRSAQATDPDAGRRWRERAVSATSQNPWPREGVSIPAGNLADLMPIVGQQKLFKRLERFRDDIVSPAGQDLAGFFMVIGGWGVGKSRVGHEICLESCSDEVCWILDGAPHRLLEPSLKQGILPLFLRYIQVTKGPLG